MNHDPFFILHSIFKKMRKIADRELFPLGIAHTEMRLLNMIYFYNADGCTQDEFISKIEIDRSNIGRALKKLENQGYIRREKSQIDHRSWQIFLTDKGWSIRERLLQIRDNIKKAFSTDMHESEVQTLVNLLSKADQNLNEENYIKIIENNKS